MINVLVNYEVDKNGKVEIVQYKYNDKPVIVYDTAKIAVASADLDTTKELTVILFNGKNMPVIAYKDVVDKHFKKVTPEEAEQLGLKAEVEV